MLTLCIGGVFAILRETRVLEVAISKLAAGLGNRGLLVVPILMVVFATIDTFIGSPELCMVYIPIIMPLILALRFDSLTAVAIVLLGSCAGFTASLTNPFLVGISQKIAGVPLYSGIEFRFICFVVTVLMVIAFVMHHAWKVRKDPKSSPTYEADEKLRQKMAMTQSMGENEKFTGSQKITGLVVILGFATMIFGILKLGWDLPEMSATFIIIGIIAGLLAKMSTHTLCDTFVEGCKEVLMGALIIGVARSVPILMEQGQILDTVVHGLASVVVDIPSSLTATGILGMTTLFNFVISSGSGKAMILMPIIAPLAEFIELSPNVAILAYQYGDGMTMMFWPTSGFFMAALAVSRTPWLVWAKFSWKIFLMMGVLGSVLIYCAQLYGY
ncbi:C4-dicarboxylate ABC transporter [Pseudomonas putida]|nr:C4-dicarboxylate ABC transporter [Pseudomonas putida]